METMRCGAETMRCGAAAAGVCMPIRKRSVTPAERSESRGPFVSARKPSDRCAPMNGPRVAPLCGLPGVTVICLPSEPYPDAAVRGEARCVVGEYLLIMLVEEVFDAPEQLDVMHD